uniref:Uncharacterized protein n=1 Tax=Anguilla anguilla TaxID=7936 RepID=A0A0E9T0J5_ANGAN
MKTVRSVIVKYSHILANISHKTELQTKTSKTGLPLLSK